MNLFPGKSKNQIVAHATTLLGQQSLRELRGLHLDVDKLREGNRAKSGDGIRRKGTLIVGPDVPLNEEEYKKTQRIIKRKYGLNEYQLKILPKPVSIRSNRLLKLESVLAPKFNLSTVERLEHLRKLQAELGRRLPGIFKSSDQVTN